ncbi:hypothetical protein HPB50_009833 [Hyalomma asiaticum]|uniref:Uncharacterized protein n=1 Tax=Hyalomma asiaticum TaxID=266040 RepID=A0ACB7TF25_HYAAI|nr:hypothetical protein HPB50_009833 [Hyalomma asiaticum]
MLPWAPGLVVRGSVEQRREPTIAVHQIAADQAEHVGKSVRAESVSDVGKVTMRNDVPQRRPAALHNEGSRVNRVERVTKRNLLQRARGL